jgi:hypothetical protein
MNEQEPATAATQQLDVKPEPLSEGIATEAAAVALEPPAAESAPEPVAPTEPEALSQPVAQPSPVSQPVVEAPPEAKPQPVAIPVAEQAPLVASSPSVEAQPAAEPNQLLGLPLQLVNQLLARLGATPLQSLAELLPALRIISLLVVAGITLKLTGATLGAINEIPLVGRLLELVGLISALNFLARNATKSQKRAELLARIQKLKRDLLG